MRVAQYGPSQRKRVSLSMMISLRGMRVLGIRTTYDPAKGRGFGSQVISFKSYLSTIDQIRNSSPQAAAQLEGLREEEVEQLRGWLSARAEQRSQASNQQALPNLERQLDLAISALDTEPGRLGLTPELAERLYMKIRNLQKQMKKSGHSRPKISAPVKVGD